MEDNIINIFDFLMNLETEHPYYYPLSCIYGAFLGDALGSFCEFNQPNKENHLKIESNLKNIFHEPKGRVTDDSEMAMSLAGSILDMPKIKELNPNFIYFYYGTWMESNPSDMGNTTRYALQHFKGKNTLIYDSINQNILEQIKSDNNSSLANGSLMRNTPLSVWFYISHKNKLDHSFNSFNSLTTRKQISTLEKYYLMLKEEVRKDCQLTHPNIEMISADAFVCLLSILSMITNNSNKVLDCISLLLKSDTFTLEENKEDYLFGQKIKETIKEVEDKNEDKKYEEEFFNSFYKMAGYYMHSIRLIIHSLYLFKRKQSRNKFEVGEIFMEIMNFICDVGGDTDTNAAIVGGVIGPLVGYKNFGGIFEEMFKMIYKKRIIYSPAFMVFYVDYLFTAKNKGFKKLMEDSIKNTEFKEESNEFNFDPKATICQIQNNSIKDNGSLQLKFMKPFEIGDVHSQEPYELIRKLGQSSSPTVSEKLMEIVEKEKEENDEGRNKDLSFRFLTILLNLLEVDL
ncbi:MAG: ADP-ribosylglycohydrolase family protein [archaeon]|nr:ADP-ribosylglycohydrolase family protein [archaeon]